MVKQPVAKYNYFSEAAWQSEERGLTHWLLISDGSSVYAYNAVKGTEPVELITGLKDVTQIAVD